MAKVKKIKVLINGIPGNMASNVAEHVLKDDQFELILFSLTGSEITASKIMIGLREIILITPDRRERIITCLKETEGDFIAVDFTHPLAVNNNAEFYCQHNLPFIMGTTGGDKRRLKETVERSTISAVIAPNMAKQIVGFQTMMEYTANTFPNLFAGYSLEIRESHQSNKFDTSATAKAMVKQSDGSPGIFNKLGIPFSEEDIIKIRKPEFQRKSLGVPEQYLAGHGWHTYTLFSPDKTVKFEFTHNVNGRDIYARGALDAISFLNKKINENIKGKVFTMIDVLKG